MGGVKSARVGLRFNLLPSANPKIHFQTLRASVEDLNQLKTDDENSLRDINSLSPELCHGGRKRDLYDPGEGTVYAGGLQMRDSPMCENNSLHATLSVDVSGSDQTAKGLHREAMGRTEGAVLGSPKEYVLQSRDSTPRVDAEARASGKLARFLEAPKYTRTHICRNSDELSPSTDNKTIINSPQLFKS